MTPQIRADVMRSKIRSLTELHRPTMGIVSAAAWARKNLLRQWANEAEKAVDPVVELQAIIILMLEEH